MRSREMSIELMVNIEEARCVKSGNGNNLDQGENDHIEHVHDPIEDQSIEDSASSVIPDDPNDPMNRSAFHRNLNLCLISFHALMTNFVGAGIIPIYSTLAEKFHTDVQTISYLTSIHILCTGLTPLFLVPVSSRYGRRPIWLISTVITAACNVGCAESSSYATMMVCRILGSLFLGAPIALAPPVVLETFAPHERGLKIGIWTAFVTLGPPLGPLIMGFVAARAGWQWVYWTFSITSGVQFFLYFFFSPETRYIRKEKPTNMHGWRKYFSFARIDPKPFAISKIIQPFLMAKHITVSIPVCSHSMGFLFSAAMLTVEIPQLFGARFGFGPEKIGLQFIGIVAGTVLGEIYNATIFKMMNRRLHAQNRSVVTPSAYLWASYPGFVLMIVGLIVFCVLLGQTIPMHYKVGPIIGIGIAGFGNQLLSSFLINYIMQVHSDNASNVSIFLGVFRQTWCFIGPFYFPSMFETVGLIPCAGLLSGLMIIAVIPLIWLHWKVAHS